MYRTARPWQDFPRYLAYSGFAPSRRRCGRVVEESADELAQDRQDRNRQDPEDLAASLSVRARRLRDGDRPGCEHPRPQDGERQRALVHGPLSRPSDHAGVSIIEALAQIGGILAYASEPFDSSNSLMYFLGIDKAKFRHTVTPGDRLDLYVEVLHHRSNVWRLRGEATVEGTLCAQGDLLASIRGFARPEPKVGRADIHDRSKRASFGNGSRRSAALQGGRRRIASRRPSVSGRRTRSRARARRRGRPLFASSDSTWFWAREPSFRRTSQCSDRRGSGGAIGSIVRRDRRRAAGSPYAGEPTTLEIGDDNVFREQVTVHRGTRKGGGTTRIGSRCLLMVGAHVAHDCTLEDDVVLTNLTALGGHVYAAANVVCGGLSAVAPFVRLGRACFLAGGAMVERDVPPFVIAAGDRARGARSEPRRALALGRSGRLAARAISRIPLALSLQSAAAGGARRHTQRARRGFRYVAELLQFLRRSAT